MKRGTLLLCAALFMAVAALLMWLSTPKPETASPTQVTAAAPSPLLTHPDYRDTAATVPTTTSTDPEPVSEPAPEGGAAMAEAIDKLPLESLRKGMNSFLANYPKEATEYALQKIQANSDTHDPATLVYSNSIAYGLAVTDRKALAQFLAALPENVREFASYAATARYVDDGDLASALASLTPDSQPFAVMQVSQLYAARDPQGAAGWTQQFRDTNNYQMALMPVIRAFAKTDAGLARRWLNAMPEGSNQKMLLAELDSAP